MEPFVVVQALWLFLPAYLANMGPVFAMKAFPRWNAPMDGGRVWRDGRRVLGAGKTWRGLLAGAGLGATFAYGQSFAAKTDWDLSDFGRDAGWGVPLALGFALGLGAILGDAAKSFFKRRTGREGGAPWVPFDQLDFVLGALVFGALGAWSLDATGVTQANWFVDEFWGDRWPVLAVVVVATPLLHFVVNVIGYKLRMKKVPW